VASWAQVLVFDVAAPFCTRHTFHVLCVSCLAYPSYPSHRQSAVLQAARQDHTKLIRLLPEIGLVCMKMLNSQLGELTWCSSLANLHDFAEAWSTPASCIRQGRCN
jgi:hypothetical protein